MVKQKRSLRMLDPMNLLKVALASLLSFMLGGFWYSPALFLNVWAKESGLSVGGRMNENGRHPALVFGFAYALAFLSALLFSVFIGPAPGLDHALGWALAVGLVFVGGSFGINYLFGGNSMKLWLVNAGYHLLQFIIYGLLFGLWH